MQAFTKKQHPLGFWQASPMPTAEELENFYAGYFQQNFEYPDEYTQEELEYRRNKSRVVNEVLTRLGKGGGGQSGESGKNKKKRLVDIGCGEGFIMEHFFNLNWQVLGIDFGSRGIAQHHPPLLPYLMAGEPNTIIEHLKRNGEVFEVVSLLNVMEHTTDPEMLLELVRGIMNEQSTLIISVPNDFSAFQLHMLEYGRIGNEFWFSPPEHLQYYNLANLSALLESRRFRVVFSYADFPVELYLANEHSCYISDQSKGKAAHNSRLFVDNFLVSRGLKKYVDYASAMADIGLGRNIVVFAELEV